MPGAAQALSRKAASAGKDSSLRHSIDVLVHLFSCLQPFVARGRSAVIPVPSKLGMVFKGTFGHRSWKTCLEMRLSRKIRCYLSILFPACSQSAASLWDSDIEGSYGFHQASKDHLCYFAMLIIILSHRGWSKYLQLCGKESPAPQKTQHLTNVSLHPWKYSKPGWTLFWPAVAAPAPLW